MHGGQRLIVFRGNRYVGQYSLTPEVGMAVTGTNVVLTVDRDTKAILTDFSRGPPSQILGEPFFR